MGVRLQHVASGPRNGGRPVKRVYGAKIYKPNVTPSAKEGGKPSYRIRWKLPGRDTPFSATFDTETELNSFAAELVTAKNRGEAFDLDTGLPVSMLAPEATAEVEHEEPPSLAFFALAQDYAAMKWPDLSAKSREAVAQTLTALTVALVSNLPKHPDEDVLWKALSTYAFVPSLWPDNKRSRRIPRSPHFGVELPADQKAALDWIEKASLPTAELEKTKVARLAIDQLKATRDGRKAADSYFTRRRGIFVNFIGYAIEREELDVNPLTKLREKAPKKSGPIDRSVAFNPAQGDEMLTAISYVGSYGRARGRRLVVFFAMLFYAFMRPEEALNVHDYECTLPESNNEWGNIRLSETKPTAGKRWTNSGEIHDTRGLKGRSDTAVRNVPIPPVLVAIIRAHIAEFGTATDGRLVTNERGGIPVASTYTRVWREARPFAFTPAQISAGFAKNPYSGRHAGFSMLLNSGVDVMDAAERGGNSPEVIQRVYGHRTDGRDQINNRKVDAFLSEHAPWFSSGSNRPSEQGLAQENGSDRSEDRSDTPQTQNGSRPDTQ